MNYLNPVSLGPFVARVLEALGQRVTYDQSVLPTGRVGDLGFLNPRSNQRGPANLVPQVPLSAVVRDIIMSVMDQAIARDTTSRDPTVQRIAPIPTSDRDLLSTPKCPESCFRQMEQDLNSRCIPVQPVPAGVDGDGQRRKMPPTRFLIGIGNAMRTSVGWKILPETVCRSRICSLSLWRIVLLRVRVTQWVKVIGCRL